MKKKIFTRNDTPEICLTDNVISLIEKFKNYFFVIDRTEDDITFYILRDKGSTDIDTTDYFGISIRFEDGMEMIDSIFSNKTKFTLKYSIESKFNVIARFTPLGKEQEITCISVHWPEPIDDDNEDVEEIQYVEPDEDKIVWSSLSNPLKPIWQGEKIEPLKSVEDN